MDRNLGNEIAAVYVMGAEELAERFAELYGFPPGQTSMVTIRNRIIYRLQEDRFGGVSDEDMEFLKGLIADDPLAHLVRKPVSRVTKTPGARYTRMWKGRRYEVVVRGADRFELDGKIYSSLSAAARSITGTRWNGKVFFGVKE